jgi:hypothetical protein
MTNPLLDTKPRRPRYTIAHSNHVYIQRHYAEFPYTLGKVMAWTEQEHFTELKQFKSKPFRIAIVFDHETGMLGEIFQVNKTLKQPLYYWLMYGREVGADGQPHIRSCYWIDYHELR